MKNSRVVRFAFGMAIGLAILGLAATLAGQDNDDYTTISRLATPKERRDFFVKLSPERKSALWRKHYQAELTKHPELTPDQKAVVNLAIVMASPDLFTGKFPDVAGPGSIFDTALQTAFKDAPKLRIEIFGQPAPPLTKSD
jgi:hypothetical protein